MPSLHTFLVKQLLATSEMVVFDPNAANTHPEDTKTFGPNLTIEHVYKISSSILDKLREFGNKDFTLSFIYSSKPIAPVYTRLLKEMTRAYHKVIELEHTFTNLKYKYSAVVHDNKLLASTSPAPVQEIDSSEKVHSKCERCKNIKTL